MSLTVKKTEPIIAISTDVDDMTESDKLALLKQEYGTARSTAIDYANVRKEIEQYMVMLPADPSIADISEINKLYALAQSYLSRITAIEVTAIDNASRWKRLSNLMDGYIEDRSSEILVSEEIIDLSVQKAEAKVRVALKKEYHTWGRIKDRQAEAESFSRMIESKKKDMVSVLTTLGKQVKALSLEQALQR
jgi:hypothetical protein